MAILVLLATSALGVSGCQEEAAPGPLRGATIEVIGGWSGGEQDAFTKVYEIFERETGAEVRYVAGGDDTSALLQARIQGHKPPNVAIMAQPGLVQQLAASGHLTELTDEVAEEVRRGYGKIWRTLGSHDGRLYAVFYKATNKSSVWYNAKLLLDEYGQEELPKTWDEFLDVCRELSDFGVSPLSIGAADGWVLTDWFENVYLQVAGVELYDRLSRHEIPWDHESVRKALTTLAEVFGHDDYLDGGREGALQTEFEASVVRVFGPQPSAVMVYEGDFVAGVINTDTPARVGHDAKVFPFPTIDRSKSPGGVVVGGDAAVALTDDEATMAFMKFLASPRAGTAWTEQGGFLSPNKLVAVNSYPDGLTRQLARQIMLADDNIRYDMSDLYPAQFGATKGVGEWKAMQDFLNDPGDIDAVVRQLEADAAKAVG
jgi:ABC-type glycerol-3-phosphate transport system substrate-binding protein